MKAFVPFLVVAYAVFCRPVPAVALDHFKLLDVQVGENRFEGRVLTHDDETCWLLQRDGRLQQFATSGVTEFVERKDRFKPNSAAEIQKQLQAEFGSEYEVRTSTHYVVAADPGSAKAYVSLFERIYGEFVSAFRSRGLVVVDAEFPLVAIVFPDKSGFLDYCKSEETRVPQGVVGCYLFSSNRVAMYELSTSDEIDTTIIHEAIHQIAFNTGVHSRVAKDPKWVVEGLATVFESDGIRSRQQTRSLFDRLNRGRYLWFDEYVRTRRRANSLREFIRDDKPFDAASLDAYSEAWALSFYLLETKSIEYSRYLKKLAARDPLKPYDANAREKDFTDAFGRNLERLDASFLLFMKNLQTARGDSGGR